MKNLKNKIEPEELEPVPQDRSPYFDNLLAEQQRRVLLPEDFARVQAAQEAASE